jgi:hypothetical protein
VNSEREYEGDHPGYLHRLLAKKVKAGARLRWSSRFGEQSRYFLTSSDNSSCKRCSQFSFLLCQAGLSKYGLADAL